MVVAGRVESPFCRVAIERAGHQLRRCPDGTVGKTDAVDRRVLGARLSGDGDPVLAALNMQDEIATFLLHDDVPGRDTAAKGQLIGGVPPPGRSFPDGVAAVAPVKAIGRIPWPAG